MLDYKKAKELKDVGFPQCSPRKAYCLDCEKWKKIECFENRHHTVFIYSPLLEEVIEELVKNYKGFELFEETDSWKAAINYPYLEFARGKTPLEAVCNLYIKLNKTLCQK